MQYVFLFIYKINTTFDCICADSINQVEKNAERVWIFLRNVFSEHESAPKSTVCISILCPNMMYEPAFFLFSLSLCFPLHRWWHQPRPYRPGDGPAGQMPARSPPHQRAGPHCTGLPSARPPTHSSAPPPQLSFQAVSNPLSAPL